MPKALCDRTSTPVSPRRAVTNSGWRPSFSNSGTLTSESAMTFRFMSMMVARAPARWPSCDVRITIFRVRLVFTSSANIWAFCVRLRSISARRMPSQERMIKLKLIAQTAVMATNEASRMTKCRERKAFAACPGGGGIADSIAGCESVAIGGQRQRQQGLLFDVVSFCRTGGWAGARRALYREHMLSTSEMTQSWQHVVQRAHVCRLFLHPDDFPRI